MESSFLVRLQITRASDTNRPRKFLRSGKKRDGPSHTPMDGVHTHGRTGCASVTSRCRKTRKRDACIAPIQRMVTQASQRQADVSRSSIRIRSCTWRPCRLGSCFACRRSREGSGVPVPAPEPSAPKRPGAAACRRFRDRLGWCLRRSSRCCRSCSLSKSDLQRRQLGS